MTELYAPYANILGHVGVLCFLIAFFLLQKNKLAHDSMCYLGLNLLGALLVMLSLLVEWNAPAFVLEACWALISIYGIYSNLRRRRQTQSR